MAKGTSGDPKGAQRSKREREPQLSPVVQLYDRAQGVLDRLKKGDTKVRPGDSEAFHHLYNEFLRIKEKDVPSNDRALYDLLCADFDAAEKNIPVVDGGSVVIGDQEAGKKAPTKKTEIKSEDEPSPADVRTPQLSSPDSEKLIELQRAGKTFKNRLRKLTNVLPIFEGIEIGLRDPALFEKFRSDFHQLVQDFFQILGEHNLLQSDGMIEDSAPEEWLGYWDQLADLTEGAEQLEGWSMQTTSATAVTPAPAPAPAPAKAPAPKKATDPAPKADAKEPALDKGREPALTPEQIRIMALEYRKSASEACEYIGMIIAMPIDTPNARFAARVKIDELEGLLAMFREDWAKNAAKHLRPGEKWTTEWQLAADEYDRARDRYQTVKENSEILRAASEKDWETYEKEFDSRLATFGMRLVFAKRFGGDRRITEATGLRAYLEELRDHWRALKLQLWAEDPEVAAINRFDVTLREMRAELEQMMREKNARALRAEQITEALAETMTRAHGCWNETMSYAKRYAFLERFVAGTVKPGEEGFQKYVDNPVVFLEMVKPLLEAYAKVQMKVRVDQEMSRGATKPRDATVSIGRLPKTMPGDAGGGKPVDVLPDTVIPADASGATAEPLVDSGVDAIDTVPVMVQAPREGIAETERVREIARILADDMFWEPTVSRSARVTRIGAIIRSAGGTRLKSDAGLRPDRVDAFYEAAGFADEADLAARMDAIRARFASVDTAGAEPADTGEGDQDEVDENVDLSGDIDDKSKKLDAPVNTQNPEYANLDNNAPAGERKFEALVNDEDGFEDDEDDEDEPSEPIVPVDDAELDLDDDDEEPDTEEEEPDVVPVVVETVPEEETSTPDVPPADHPEEKVASLARWAMDKARRLFGGGAKAEAFTESPDAAPIEPAEARAWTFQGIVRALTPVLGSKIFADSLQHLSRSFVADRTRSQLHVELLDALHDEKEAIRNGADDESQRQASLQAIERVTRVIDALDPARFSDAEKATMRGDVFALREKYLAPTEENTVAQYRALAEILEQHVRATVAEWEHGSASMSALETIAQLPFGKGLAYGITQFRNRFEGSLAKNPDASRVAHVAVAFREAWNAERAARNRGEAMNAADAADVLGAAYGVKVTTSPFERVISVLRKADAEDLDEAAGLVAQARKRLHEFIDGVLGPAEKKAAKVASVK